MHVAHVITTTRLFLTPAILSSVSSSSYILLCFSPQPCSHPYILMLWQTRSWLACKGSAILASHQSHMHGAVKDHLKLRVHVLPAWLSTTFVCDVTHVAVGEVDKGLHLESCWHGLNRGGKEWPAYSKRGSQKKIKWCQRSDVHVVMNYFRTDTSPLTLSKVAFNMAHFDLEALLAYHGCGFH